VAGSPLSSPTISRMLAFTSAKMVNTRRKADTYFETLDVTDFSLLFGIDPFPEVVSTSVLL
jgi:hypothetical protein